MEATFACKERIGSYCSPTHLSLVSQVEKKERKKKEKLTVIFCVQLLKKNTQPFLHGVITRKLLFRGIFKWILTSNADVVVFETH